MCTSGIPQAPKGPSLSAVFVSKIVVSAVCNYTILMYSPAFSAGRVIAGGVPKGPAGGKSGLRKARHWLTTRRQVREDLATDSATENKPPGA